MRQGQGDDGRVVAVIGDGAMTGGVAFEALHQAGGLGTPIVVVLNDNGMSIAPNVGALSRYFNRVRLNPKLWKAREDVERGLTKLPGGIGAALRAPRPAAEGVDQGVLGARPVLGGARLGLHGRHRRPRRAARCAARCARRWPPTARSSSTSPPSRARASRPAEEGDLEGMEKWHAAKPKSIANGAAGDAAAKPNAEQARAAAVHEGLRRGARGGVRARRARRRHHRGDELRHGPEHAPGGRARALLRRRHRRAERGPVRRRPRAPGRQAGRAPSTRPSSSAPTTRSSTTSACRSSTSSFAMDRAGLVGDDGPTHHGVFDIAYLRCLPNIVLMAPRDEAMLVAHAAHRDAPRRRPDRAALPARRGRRRRRCRARPEPIEIGTGEILREGDARRARRLRHRRAEGARGRRPARRGRPRGHRGRRALRQADRRRPAGPARGRARPARDGRGGRAGGRLRLRRLGDASTTRAARSPRILRVGLPDRYVTHGKPALLHEEVGYTGRRDRRSASRPPSRPARARSPARERRPAPAGPRAARDRARRRRTSPARPTSRPSAPPTCRPRWSSAGAVEEVARVEDVVIPDVEGGRAARRAPTGRPCRPSRSACSCGCTAAAGTSATSSPSTASTAPAGQRRRAPCA